MNVTVSLFDSMNTFFDLTPGTIDTPSSFLSLFSFFSNTYTVLVINLVINIVAKIIIFSMYFFSKKNKIKKKDSIHDLIASGVSNGPSPMEQSLKHVGGLPPMAAALATNAPHLIPPHMLPRGGESGDPRDNGRPGHSSQNGSGRRDEWMYDQKGNIISFLLSLIFTIIYLLINIIFICTDLRCE